MSSLPQLMACCLVGTKSLPELMLTDLSNFNQNIIISIEESVIENIPCNMSAFFFRPQCVNCIANAPIVLMLPNYCQTSNISHTLVGNNTVDHSDVVGASPVVTAPTTSSFST